MNAGIIKDGLNLLLQYIPVKFSATGWYFHPVKPGNAVMPDSGTWTCMFSFIKKVARGEKLCLSAQDTGCRGAACYLGFKKPGIGAGDFLAEKERFKKNPEIGNAFYEGIQAPPAKEDYLVLERIEDIENGIDIEVVNLWTDALALAGLVTLANYDRSTNNNVLIPFASGCQSIWTIPYKEKFEKEPKAVAGVLDPSVRIFFPSDVLSFSVSANRFIEMTGNISGSFLEENNWLNLVKAI